MSDKSHGPETDCDQCTECPACDGVGYNDDGPMTFIQTGNLIVGQCTPCEGSAVYCPNYVRPVLPEGGEVMAGNGRRMVYKLPRLHVRRSALDWLLDLMAAEGRPVLPWQREVARAVLTGKPVRRVIRGGVR